MSGDITLQGHDMSPVFGFDGERYSFCSCSDTERFEGRTIVEVRDLHNQHCERIEAVLVAPMVKEAARRGLERSRQSLADTVARKGAAS